MARNAKSNGKSRPPNEYAVIGLGGFGANLARRLEAMGHFVLGLDSDIARVQAISDDITSAVALDATNEDALQEVDIASYDTVVVAMARSFEASALVTAYLKALGTRRVICVAETRRHRDILLRIGADQVIVSDEDSGVRLAETLAAPNLLERVLLDADHSLTELKVPRSLVSQPVSSLQRFEASVLLIQRSGHLLPNPSPETQLAQDDTLFVVGEREQLLQLAALP
jgi:trk system potassium uptake protein TrkA